MLAAVLLSLFLSIPAPTTVHSTIAGVWVLNLGKSDWGRVPTPEQVVLKIEQLDHSLSVWEVAVSRTGRLVSYRQLPLKGDRCSKACVVFASTGIGEERWEISETGELIVNREARFGVGLVHQHLVLEPTTELGD